ncbi:MAG: hypothetical protein E7555_10250 [Ruminococcaceae bacterium]|nr:hypothetical protein [Oscillospiraceae bacterium]
MNLPKRKPTRLKRYDYSAPGAYFITICTQNRKQILSKISIVGEGLRALPKNELTKTGNVVKNAVDFINKVYQNISVDKYVIMPNHVHLLISITGGHGDPPLPQIIGQFKSFTQKSYTEKLWQRSFHDHIIRGDKDYEKIWEYIDTNVLRWKDDCFYEQEESTR